MLLQGDGGVMMMGLVVGLPLLLAGDTVGAGDDMLLQGDGDVMVMELVVGITAVVNDILSSEWYCVMVYLQSDY